MRRLCITLFLSLCMFGGNLAVAEPLDIMPFEGVVSDSNGNPVNGDVTLTFQAYEAEDSTSAVWTEVHDNVPVADGQFVVYLGMYTSLSDFFSQDAAYMGIRVNDDVEALPRMKIGSTPYAINASDTYYFRGLAPADFLRKEEAIRDYVSKEDLDARSYVTAAGATAAAEAAIAASDVIAANTAKVGISQVQADAIDANTTAIADLGDTYVTIEAFQNGGVGAVDLTNYYVKNEVDSAIAAAVAGLQSQADAGATFQTLAAADAAAQQTATELANLSATLREEMAVQMQVLLARIEALENSNQPYILGYSSPTDGSINVDGKQGVAGANELCKNAFADETTAHLCGYNEAFQALSEGRYPDGLAEEKTWSIGETLAGNLENTCHGLLYNSADIATGTTLELEFAYQPHPQRADTGAVVRLERGQTCNTELPVLCCR